MFTDNVIPDSVRVIEPVLEGVPVSKLKIVAAWVGVAESANAIPRSPKDLVATLVGNNIFNFTLPQIPHLSSSAASPVGELAEKPACLGKIG